VEHADVVGAVLDDLALPFGDVGDFPDENLGYDLAPWNSNASYIRPHHRHPVLRFCDLVGCDNISRMHRRMHQRDLPCNLDNG
jgi:hypothetical protein